MKKRILYLIIFIGIGWLLLQIPFTNIIGSNQKFSLFDFFAPATGMLLTSIWGAISVVGVKFFNALFSGQSFDTVTIIRLFPLALGALYFGARKSKYVVAIIPLICIALFIAHPEGRQAWFFSLYWLIPVVAVFVKKSLVLNSLGATFTAHAVGGAAFLYALNLPAEVWIALIPVVFLERMLFTAGITVSYVATNTVINWLSIRLNRPSLQRFIKPEYTFSKQLLSNL